MSFSKHQMDFYKEARVCMVVMWEWERAAYASVTPERI